MSQSHSLLPLLQQGRRILMALINGRKERSCLSPGTRKGPWPKLLNVWLWLCQWAVSSLLFMLFPPEIWIHSYEEFPKWYRNGNDNRPRCWTPSCAGFLLKNRNQEFDDKKLQSQLCFQFLYSIATNCRMMFVTNLYSEKPFKDMTKIQPSLYSLQQYHLVLWSL